MPASPGTGSCAPTEPWRSRSGTGSGGYCSTRGFASSAPASISGRTAGPAAISSAHRLLSEEVHAPVEVEPASRLGKPGAGVLQRCLGVLLEKARETIDPDADGAFGAGVASRRHENDAGMVLSVCEELAVQA